MLILKQAPTEEFRLGLEQEGKSLMETGISGVPIPFVNNKFVHGLNEDQVRLVEDHYGHSFDNKEHREFWAGIYFDVPHTIKSLDMDYAPDVLLYGVLTTMQIAAKNYEEIDENPNVSYKFVIYDEVQEELRKLSLYEAIDEAVVELSRLRKSSKRYMLALAKYLLPNPSLLGDNAELAYTQLRSFINGDMTPNKGDGAEAFSRALTIEKERLYVLLDFRAAKARNIIYQDNKQRYFNPKTGTVYGKTEDECVEFLLNPSNQAELGVGADAPEYSIRKQLKK